MPYESIKTDEQPVFDALLQAGVDPQGAYTAVRGVRELAGQNIVALIESRFDGLKAQFDGLKAQFDAQNSQIAAQFDSVNAQFKAVDAKFDSVDAKFEVQNARFDALHRENATTRRWIALGFSGLGIMMTVLRFLD